MAELVIIDSDVTADEFGCFLTKMGGKVWLERCPFCKTFRSCLFDILLVHKRVKFFSLFLEGPILPWVGAAASCSSHC